MRFVWAVLVPKISHDWGYDAAVSLKLLPKSDTDDRSLLADSVEKVGFSRLPAYRSLKNPFLRAVKRNLNPESTAQSKDFNLRRVFFHGGNHGRLFQRNRPKADFGLPLLIGNLRYSALRPLSLTSSTCVTPTLICNTTHKRIYKRVLLE